MKLLDPLAYRRLAAGRARPVEPSPEAIAYIVGYATRVFAELELALGKRHLRPSDVARVTRTAGATLFHVRAYPRKQKETFVIVATDDATTVVHGHILIDLAAHDAVPRLDCPSLDVDGPVTRPELRKHLARVRHDLRDPFAILNLTDGTYIQTLAGPDGYLLEHQLVNTSGHYETPRPVSLEAAIAAFVSYGFGDGEWLSQVPWRRQQL